MSGLMETDALKDGNLVLLRTKRNAKRIFGQMAFSVKTEQKPRIIHVPGTQTIQNEMPAPNPVVS